MYKYKCIYYHAYRPSTHPLPLTIEYEMKLRSIFYFFTLLFFGFYLLVILFDSIKYLKSPLQLHSSVKFSNKKLWVVVDYIDGKVLDENVNRLNQFKNHQILVILNNDDKSTRTPTFNLNNILLFDLKLQHEFCHRHLKHGCSSNVQKTIGYLFAIYNGAKYIYDAAGIESLLFDDFNSYFEFNEYTYALKYDSKSAPSSERVMNPYAYFGQPSLWPRGYTAYNYNDATKIQKRFHIWQE